MHFRSAATQQYPSNHLHISCTFGSGTPPGTSTSSVPTAAHPCRMLMPTSAVCKVSVLPAQLQALPSMGKLLVCFSCCCCWGFFAGTCISTTTSADTALVEGRAISLQITKLAKLLKSRPSLCFGKQKKKLLWSKITSKLTQQHPQQELLLVWLFQQGKNEKSSSPASIIILEELS